MCPPEHETEAQVASAARACAPQESPAPSAAADTANAEPPPLTLKAPTLPALEEQLVAMLLERRKLASPGPYTLRPGPLGNTDILARGYVAATFYSREDAEYFVAAAEALPAAVEAYLAAMRLVDTERTRELLELAEETLSMAVQHVRGREAVDQCVATLARLRGAT